MDGVMRGIVGLAIACPRWLLSSEEPFGVSLPSPSVGNRGQAGEWRPNGFFVSAPTPTARPLVAPAGLDAGIGPTGGRQRLRCKAVLWGRAWDTAHADGEVSVCGSKRLTMWQHKGAPVCSGNALMCPSQASDAL